MVKYRFDLVISYWIFAWFVLHMAGWIRASPKLALVIGLVANVFIFTVMVVYKNPNALYFAPINIAIKAVPLYFVWREKIQWKQDLQNLSILLAGFVAWNLAVGENPLQNASEFARTWQTGSTPPESYPGTELLRRLMS
jgi:hypothetical protein